MNAKNLKQNEINIGEKKINLSQRFTLIQGKFRKDIFACYKHLAVYDLIKSYNFVPLKIFVSFYKNNMIKFSDLDECLKLTDILLDFKSLMNNNLSLLMEYSGIIANYNLLLEYIQLLTKREVLLKELELSKIKAKSSNFSAKSDLLNKLSQSIKDTQNQLNYLEEDYLKIKTKRDQINNSIKEKNLQMSEFNKEKKNYFSEINAITRGMEDDGYSQNKKAGSASERIKSLQNQAKEAQFNIKKIQLNLKDLGEKQEKIESKFQKIDGDYQKLVHLLNKETKRLNALKKELNEDVNKSTELISVDLSQMNEIRTFSEIELDLESVKLKIDYILDTNDIFKEEDVVKTFNELNKAFEGFQLKFTRNKNNIAVTKDQKYILDIIYQFRAIESLMHELQKITNKMLSEIRLKVVFYIVIEEKNEDFSLSIKFKRSNKDQIDFKDLTTPEKIFFIISLNLAIQIQLDQDKIFFSNLFVENEFNKRGSIYRTIRKILPVIERDINFKDRRYIFVISNLEMKKPIENLKIIKIEE